MDEIEAIPHPLLSEIDPIADEVNSIIHHLFNICKIASSKVPELSNQDLEMLQLAGSFIQPMHDVMRIAEFTDGETYLKQLALITRNVLAETMPVWSRMMIQGQTAAMQSMSAQQKAEGSL